MKFYENEVLKIKEKIEESQMVVLMLEFIFIFSSLFYIKYAQSE